MIHSDAVFFCYWPSPLYFMLFISSLILYSVHQILKISLIVCCPYCVRLFIIFINIPGLSPNSPSNVSLYGVVLIGWVKVLLPISSLAKGTLYFIVLLLHCAASIYVVIYSVVFFTSIFTRPNAILQWIKQRNTMF